MKDDKTTPAHDLTPRADSDVTDSGSPPPPPPPIIGLTATAANC